MALNDIMTFPDATGGVYGLDLSEPKLVDMYEATLQALVYETKFIIDQIGYVISFPFWLIM